MCILFDHIAGPPSAVSSITTTTITSGCFSATVSWDPVNSDPVCGPVSYGLTISSSDGVVVMNTTIQTSYSFTGLTPDSDYTVAVAGVNDAGMGEPVRMIVSVAGNFCAST